MTLTLGLFEAIGVKAVMKTVLVITLLLCSIANPAFSQALQRARTAELVQDYDAALQVYKKWLATDLATGAEKRYVKIKLPVLEEAVRLGGGVDLALYLDALSARSDQNISLAISLLNKLLADHSGSRLRDDSHYLIGYMQLMDQFDFSGAGKAMADLQADFPDSRYIDSALYIQAIAFEQLGDSAMAAKLFGKLRQRHTAFSIAAIDFLLPKDQLVSRYWFTRSDRRLKIIDSANENAARILSRTAITDDDYQWRMVVKSGGGQYTLLLKPSSILNGERFPNAMANSVDKEEIEVMIGVVEGSPDSWVRITLQGSSLSGTISIQGYRQPLMAAATDGSLGFYNQLLRSDIDGNGANLQDDLLQPPTSNAINNQQQSINNARRATNLLNNVTHIARLGVVIDTQFNDYHGGNGYHKALSILNTADGIFQEEFGIGLRIQRVVVIPDRNNDPMKLGRITLEKMMRNFRSYRREKLGSDIGMATLFSGNKNSDLPLGLAWIATACRTDAYDVSVVTPFNKPGLLSTHEIAHSLGAPHDYETACGESRHLMSRGISHKTKQTFSNCSRQLVAEHLSRSRCHVQVPRSG